MAGLTQFKQLFTVCGLTASTDCARALLLA